MNRGEHNRPGKTKEIMIQYLLVSPDGLEEPILRNFLQKKYDIRDQKTIKMHLEQLRKMGCIKKYEKTGLSNHWKIDKIEHFIKIFEEFPELHVDLQVNNQLINMLLQKHQSILKESDLKYFKSFIEDSPKFLEIFLKKSPDKIIKAADYIPEINTDFDEYQEIKDRPILKFYCASKILDILNDPIYEK